jgi:hypothetical protein
LKERRFNQPALLAIMCMGYYGMVCAARKKRCSIAALKHAAAGRAAVQTIAMPGHDKEGALCSKKQSSSL